MLYLHIRATGLPTGYYPEDKGWEAIKGRNVKFLAGPLTREDCEELRTKSIAQGRRPLPVYS